MKLAAAFAATMQRFAGHPDSDATRAAVEMAMDATLRDAIVAGDAPETLAPIRFYHFDDNGRAVLHPHTTDPAVQAAWDEYWRDDR